MMDDANGRERAEVREAGHATEEPRRRRVLPAIPVVIAVVAAVVVAGVLLGVFLSLGEDTDRTAGQTSIADIVDDPSKFEGDMVLTSGRVNTILAPDSFTLKTGDTLVLVPEGNTVSRSLVEGNPVYLEATVINFDLQMGSNTLGHQLSEDEYGEYVGRVALVASGVSPTLIPSELDQ